MCAMIQSEHTSTKILTPRLCLAGAPEKSKDAVCNRMHVRSVTSGFRHVCKVWGLLRLR